MKIKLPRKRKKRYIKRHGNGGYKLSILAAEVCMEMDEKNRGFKFHSKFPMHIDRRCRVLQYW